MFVYNRDTVITTTKWMTKLAPESKFISLWFNLFSLATMTIVRNICALLGRHGVIDYMISSNHNCHFQMQCRRNQSHCNVIITSKFTFHDYTSFEKVILCDFNPIPTWSEFINCISCIILHGTHLTIVTTYIMRQLVAKYIFPKYSDNNVNCNIMDLNGMLWIWDVYQYRKSVQSWSCCKGSQPLVHMVIITTRQLVV